MKYVRSLNYSYIVCGLLFNSFISRENSTLFVLHLSLPGDQILSIYIIFLDYFVQVCYTFVDLVHVTAHHCHHITHVCILNQCIYIQPVL